MEHIHINDLWYQIDPIKLRLYCHHSYLIVRNVMQICQTLQRFHTIISLKSQILVDNLLHKTKIVPGLSKDFRQYLVLF